MKPKMTAKRIQAWTPALVSGLISISAVGLFVHTSSSRELAAKARRREAQEAAASLLASREPDSTAGSQGNSLRQSLSAAGRRSIMGKRLDGVRAVANSLDRTRALLALMREFEPGDFKLAMDECQDGQKLATESKAILEEWSRRDPLAALAYVGQDADMEAGILGTWSESDPQEVLNWARQNAGDDSGPDLAGPVIAAIAKTNPKLAMDHLADLSPEAREETLTTIIEDGDRESSKAVVQWIGAIQDPDERAEVVKWAFDHWETYETMDQKYALFEAYPETLSGEKIGKLFQDWNVADPQAVQAAVDRMPQGDLRREAISNVMEELVSNTDLRGLTQMVEKYPDDVSDEMLSESINSASEEDPDTTLKQVALIGDAGMRDSASAKVLGYWAQTDPDAVTAWMDSHQVSAPLRDKIEKLSKRGALHTMVTSQADILEALSR